MNEPKRINSNGRVCQAAKLSVGLVMNDLNSDLTDMRDVQQEIVWGMDSVDLKELAQWLGSARE